MDLLLKSFVTTMVQVDDVTREKPEFAYALFINNCLFWATIALPLWEYLITSDYEVRFIRRQRSKFAFPSILLISTRLCMLFVIIIQLAAFLPDDRTCLVARITGTLQIVVTVVGFIQVALFSALRLSAVYGGNFALFLLVFLLSLAPVPANLFVIIRTSFSWHTNLGGCMSDNSVREREQGILAIAAAVPVIVADVLVLVLTWVCSYGPITQLRGTGERAPLHSCFCRDGTLYFLCLLVLNVAQIITHRTHQNSPVGILTAKLPPILINRFMINLRQAADGSSSNDQGSTQNLSVFSQESTVRFKLSQSAVGSMGEPLDHAFHDSDLDGETFEGSEVEEAHMSQSELTELVLPNTTMLEVEA